MAHGRLIAFAALLPCLVAGACSKVDPPLDVQRVTISGRTFTLELALDDDARFGGLSNRAEIAADGGMLFVFPQPRPLSFVMRQCLVPIDLIFLDAGGRIVATHAMQVEPYDTPEAQLTAYPSEWPAQFAIELRGGTLEALNLTTGHRIDLPTEALKRRAR